MRFVAISDTHCKHKQLRLPKGDVLIHAGDISTRGKRGEILHFLEWFAAQPFEHKIFIAGNHDFFFEKEKPEIIQEVLPKGVTYLNDSGTSINGINIWGSPVTPWFFNWAFNRQRGAAIRKHWELIPGDTHVLITHGPVFGFLDLTGTDQHVGCQDLLRRQKRRSKIISATKHLIFYSKTIFRKKRSPEYCCCMALNPGAKVS